MGDIIVLSRCASQKLEWKFEGRRVYSVADSVFQTPLFSSLLTMSPIHELSTKSREQGRDVFVFDPSPGSFKLRFGEISNRHLVVNSD